MKLVYMVSRVLDNGQNNYTFRGVSGDELPGKSPDGSVVILDTDTTLLALEKVASISAVIHENKLPKKPSPPPPTTLMIRGKGFEFPPDATLAESFGKAYGYSSFSSGGGFSSQMDAIFGSGGRSSPHGSPARGL